MLSLQDYVRKLSNRVRKRTNGGKKEDRDRKNNAIENMRILKCVFLAGAHLLTHKNNPYGTGKDNHGL